MDDNEDILYVETMERLGRKMGPSAGPTKAHIVALAEEIERYREHIRYLESQVAEAKAVCQPHVSAADRENQLLKDAIVAQFLAKYALARR